MQGSEALLVQFATKNEQGHSGTWYSKPTHGRNRACLRSSGVRSTVLVLVARVTPVWQGYWAQSRS